MGEPVEEPAAARPQVSLTTCRLSLCVEPIYCLVCLVEALIRHLAFAQAVKAEAGTTGHVDISDASISQSDLVKQLQVRARRAQTLCRHPMVARPSSPRLLAHRRCS